MIVGRGLESRFGSVLMEISDGLTEIGVDGDQFCGLTEIGVNGVLVMVLLG